MLKLLRLVTVSGLALAVTLAACAVTPPRDTARRIAADGAVCPDTRRPLPFPIQRPACWSDEEWGQYLEFEAERARNGDRYNEWSFF
jgi:hypothetical protein